MFTKIFPVVIALAFAIGLIAQLALTKSQALGIAEAFKESDTSVVMISGKVTPIGHNNYIISDSSGKAELRTCPSWYRKINLRPNEHITVQGEIIPNVTRDKSTMYAIDAYRIYRKGNDNIILRTTMGKPPWTYGTHGRPE